LLATLTRRSANGPPRPCKVKGIKELIDVLDEL